LDISGHVGQGGIDALRTYLLKSGSLHGGAGGHLGLELPFLHPEQGQPPPQSPQRGDDPSSESNPSFVVGLLFEEDPRKYPTTMAVKTMKPICKGVRRMMPLSNLGSSFPSTPFDRRASAGLG